MTLEASERVDIVTRMRQVQAVAAQVGAQLRVRASSKFKAYFPDCQPTCKPDSRRKEGHVGFCRVLYGKSLDFFAAGAEHAERLFLAANRVGKTESAAYELTCHLTGRYPHWWTGRRFDRPVSAWAAGDTMQSTRDIIQVSLMGDIHGVDIGQWTGMIPAHLIGRPPTRRSGGVAKCLETIWVKHRAGGESMLELKSYDQGRKVFQGTAQHVIWLDEEPPDPPQTSATTGESNEIYTECLLRTLTTKGIIVATFTPIRGLTPFVDGYLKTATMKDTTGTLGQADKVIFRDVA